MGVRPASVRGTAPPDKAILLTRVVRCSGLALLLLAGCQLSQRADKESTQLKTSGTASLGARLGLGPSSSLVTRGTPPEGEHHIRTHREVPEKQLANPDDFRAEQWASSIFRTVLGKTEGKTKFRQSLREDELPPVWPTELPPITEPPGKLPSPKSVITLAKFARAAPPGEFLPSIPAVPSSSAQVGVEPPRAAPAPKSRSVPLPPPEMLPPSSVQGHVGSDSSVQVGLGLRPATDLLPSTDAEPFAGAGPIDIDGMPLPFDSLAIMVDGNICPGCGGSLSAGGCASCGGGGCAPGRPCPPGARQCEPFPAKTPIGRMIGLVYQCVCCPDPCYQPRWEAITDTAFFVDAVRPKSGVRFRYDRMHHFAYPDRGEFFFARADGNGRGPRANSLVRAIPFIDVNEITMITEIAMGNAGVQIAVPYRSVNSTPYGPDGAGFADMTITAKTLLLDCELALFGFQMRTYIPIGNPGKGLGTGHVSLEPALNFGLRLGPKTYLQSQVLEWIPIVGDRDYQGAHLRWGVSLNHVLWQPVKDVQLIGTLETTGFSFQDGLFTDPRFGPQKLTRQTAVALGPGMRLFFCDTLDIGVAGHFGISGKYLVRDQIRAEVRYRY